MKLNWLQALRRWLGEKAGQTKNFFVVSRIILFLILVIVILFLLCVAEWLTNLVLGIFGRRVDFGLNWDEPEYDYEYY